MRGTILTVIYCTVLLYCTLHSSTVIHITLHYRETFFRLSAILPLFVVQTCGSPPFSLEPSPFWRSWDNCHKIWPSYVQLINFTERSNSVYGIIPELTVINWHVLWAYAIYIHTYRNVCTYAIRLVLSGIYCILHLCACAWAYVHIYA